MTTEIHPIERKVQITGSGTYTVSLPKKWAARNGIDNGSVVRCVPHAEQLIISTPAAGTRYHQTIDATEKSPASLSRWIHAAYAVGCEELTIRGVDTSAQRDAVRRAVGRVIGLEITHATAEEMHVRTMLDLSDLSLDQTLLQMHRSATQLHSDVMDALDCPGSFPASDAEGIDDDIDRLFGLLVREFQRSLIDPQIPLNSDGLTTFDAYLAGWQLERIADHSVRIAAEVDRLEEPPARDRIDRVHEFGTRSQELVSTALEGLLGEPPADGLDDVPAAAQTLRADVDSERRSVTDSGRASDQYATILESLARTGEHATNLAEAAIQVRLRGSMGAPSPAG